MALWRRSYDTVGSLPIFTRKVPATLPSVGLGSDPPEELRARTELRTRGEAQPSKKK